MPPPFRSGFVNIFGPPNAGKSTLLNALLGEQLAITSPKVQTTRHRILGILNDDQYQIIFSDTPGIIEPKYKLHQKMMQQVRNALEDADVALLIADITEGPEHFRPIAEGLRLKVPTLLLLNKADLIKDKTQLEQKVAAYHTAFPQWEAIPVSALSKSGTDVLIPKVLDHLPAAPP